MEPHSMAYGEWDPTAWTSSSSSPSATAGMNPNAGGDPLGPQQLTPTASVDAYDPFAPSIESWQQQNPHNGQPQPEPSFDLWTAERSIGSSHQLPARPINLPQLTPQPNGTSTPFEQSGLTEQSIYSPPFTPPSVGSQPFDASWLPLHAGGQGWSTTYSPTAEEPLAGQQVAQGMPDWAHALTDGRFPTALAQAGVTNSSWPNSPTESLVNLNAALATSVDPHAVTLTQQLHTPSHPGSLPQTFDAFASPLYSPPPASAGASQGFSPTPPFGSPLGSNFPLYPDPVFNTTSLNGTLSHLMDLPAPSPATSGESGSPPPSSASSSRTRRSSSAINIPTVDPSHPAIARVAANRIRSGLNRASSNTSETASSLPTAGVVKEKAGKVTLELHAKCGQCGVLVAILSCRGRRDDLAKPHKPEYLCLNCCPRKDDFETEEDPTGGEDDHELKYSTTISAVLDKLAGLELAADESRPRAKPAGIGRRRRTEQEGLPCDVCARILGSGSVIDTKTRENVSFAVEVICPRCAARYQRCSDCGGGGGDGGRIGPGRWRSKELFEPGRKVCKFSHRRQGPSDNMLYDVWPVAEINALPPEQGAELRSLMRQTYMVFMLSTLAIPEQLEAPGALARNFTECLKVNEDHWAAFESLLSQDVEAGTGIRRYVGLRWSLATVRKAPKTAVGEPLLKAYDEPSTNERRLIPPGRLLASFSAGEIELKTGSLFQSLNFPKGIGEVYDQGSVVIQHMIRRIESDIDRDNEQRIPRGLEPYPQVNEIWGMYMYKRSVPFLSRRGERRGFKLLEDYLAAYPDAKREHFPPHRPCYVPIELLEGWAITARKWNREDDMTIPVGRNRRVDKNIVRKLEES